MISTGKTELAGGEKGKISDFSSGKLSRIFEKNAIELFNLG